MGRKEIQEFLKTGLISAEAEKRLEKFGPNELAKPKEFSEIKLFLGQFKSPLVYILVFAGLVTLFLQEFTDSIVIFAAVFLNTILGFWQERKAQKALSALRLFLLPKAKVIRDGEQKEIEATELVPGDLVILTIGTRVPADGVLVEATDLSVNEAILTGESMPVGKKVGSGTSRFAGLVGCPDEIGTSEEWEKLYSSLAKRPTGEATHSSLVFMGTTVVTGIAKMIIAKTGMETQIGKIGKQVEEVEEEKTPLQVQLGRLAKILAMVVGGVTLMIFLVGEFLGYDPLEMFTTSVAVAVAAIPEGLVVTLTVILALGMQRILKRKAVVRKLLAAETLGSVSVICADKTGTLTEGKMRVIKSVETVETGETKEVKKRKNWLVKAAVLCNDLRDPLEVGMLGWAEQKLSNKVIKKLREDYPRLDEIPFSPKYKYIATLHATGNRQQVTRILFLSGAPEVVLSKCQISLASLREAGRASVRCQEWLKKFEEYGEKGYRLVGFAVAETRNLKEARKIFNSLRNPHPDARSAIGVQRNLRLQWLGILIYEDPIRKGVKEALEECQEAGIKVKVVTGDYAPTAMAVLEKLGLGNGNWEGKDEKRMITGDELAKITKQELRKRIEQVVLFARTDPEQKLKIVQALKEKGEVVAMMGDGVNDAPALKTADIGIVVGEASDVAKETADMVLLDSNFATIVHVVEEGRTIFENIKKVTLYLLSCSFTEIILIGGSLLFRLPLPLTAGQILWVNLVQDSLPAVALAFEPKEEELMKDMPRKKETTIIDLPMKILIFIIGIITDFFLLGLVIASLSGVLPFRFSQTMLFVSLGIISSFIIFACRSLRKPILKYNPFANKFLSICIFLGFVFLGLAVYFPPFQILLKTHPLGIAEWVFLFGLGLFDLLAIELTKWIFIVRRKKYNNN